MTKQNFSSCLSYVSFHSSQPIPAGIYETRRISNNRGLVEHVSNCILFSLSLACNSFKARFSERSNVVPEDENNLRGQIFLQDNSSHRWDTNKYHCDIVTEQNCPLFLYRIVLFVDEGRPKIYLYSVHQLIEIEISLTMNIDIF